MAGTDFYEIHGEQLAARYDAVDAGEVHRAWAPMLRDTAPGLACDVGAGSGRDARWLAAQGWEVVAVEPCNALRRLGEARSQGHAVTWMSDTLPGLERVRAVGYRFGLVLLSAVWQHVPPPARERAFRVLANLLKPGGRLVITLRHGRDESENCERGFHAVDAGELAALARRHALVEVLRATAEDLARNDIAWETLVFEALAHGAVTADATTVTGGIT